MQITDRDITELVPYARNSRTHSDEQVAQIAGSIREFGWTNPILVDGENGIIAGHGRVLAARKLGMATVPVIELSHMTEAQKRAYIIADNKPREGWWQDRKRAWVALGIKSELGRGDNTMDDTEEGGSKFGKCLETGIGAKYGREEMNGTSIFDPVMCEIAYRWFCPVGGVAVDPFAGGSVRGIVAAKLGIQYVGVELRPEQVEANRVQA